MKSLALFLLSVYQKIVSPPLTHLLGHTCRYDMTCSVYAKEAIKKYGFFSGGQKALMRVLSCQPFFTIKGYEYI